MSTGSIKELKQAAEAIPSSVSLEKALERLASDTPRSYSLEDIARELATREGLGKRKHLLAINAYLRQDQARKPVDEAKGGGGEEVAAARRICDFAARSITPLVVDVPEDEDEDYHPTAADRERDVNAVAQRCRPLGEAGLAILDSLTRGPANTDNELLSNQALLTVIAYCSSDDPWATPEAVSLAHSILERLWGDSDRAKQESQKKNKRVVIADAILRDYVRSLFSKSRPSAVTASGRKAEFTEDRDAQQGLRQETRPTKPWKYLDLRAIPVFKFALVEADKELISQHWPLFTPVLLTLLDDTDAAIREKGLRLLKTFTQMVPARILSETGLNSVFQEAIFPTLLFLPSLTPEAESLRLQEPAYEVLIALSRSTREAGAAAAKAKPSGSSSSSTGGTGAANKLLDKVLRHGVFAAFFHAREHIRIVEVLACQASVVVDEIGIHAVKHLKDLIPMISSILEEPFATAHPPSLLAAVRALQAVISNCWPRLGRPPWRDEIIKTLVVCWLHVHNDDGSWGEKGSGSTGQMKTISEELLKTAKMLAAVTAAAGETDMHELVAPLVAQEPLLERLFGPGVTTTTATTTGSPSSLPSSPSP